MHPLCYYPAFWLALWLAALNPYQRPRHAKAAENR